MCEAKNNMQLHLHKTQQEIFDIERNINLLRKAIQDKANPLKVSQTRLEARGHRAGIEQCKYVVYCVFNYSHIHMYLHRYINNMYNVYTYAPLSYYSASAIIDPYSLSDF